MHWLMKNCALVLSLSSLHLDQRLNNHFQRRPLPLEGFLHAVSTLFGSKIPTDKAVCEVGAGIVHRSHGTDSNASNRRGCRIQMPIPFALKSRKENSRIVNSI